MNDKPHTDDFAEILTFWFKETEPEKWFIKDDKFDELVCERFEKLIKRALNGELDHWAKSADGLLALIILLDQMTRNVDRDTPMAFAGDKMALNLTLTGLDRGYLDQFDEQNNRHFLLMPMMHAEDLAVQEASLPLFEKYAAPQAYEYAVKHKVIIERFGHFPHRNKILGRPSTAEEEEFLKGPDSSF